MNQGAGALDKAKDDGIRIDFNRWQQDNPDAAKAYGVLERTVTQLTTGALEALGPGPKTDIDFIVAGRTVADLEGSPVKIKATLADGVAVANRKLKKIMQPQIEFTTTPDPKDNTGDVKTSAFPGTSSKEYTQEDPIVIPSHIANLTIGARTASLAWLLTQGLKDTDYVSFRGQVGTYKAFKEG